MSKAVNQHDSGWKALRKGSWGEEFRQDSELTGRGPPWEANRLMEIP